MKYFPHELLIHEGRHFLEYFFGVAREILTRYSQYSVVHALWEHRALEFIPFFKLLRKPYIISYQWAGQDYLRQKYSKLLRYADRVNVLTTRQVDFFLSQGIPRGRISLIPVGIDLEKYEIKDSADGGYILTLGGSYRDYPTLLAAVAGIAYPMMVKAVPPGSTFFEVDRDLPPHVTLIQNWLNFDELKALIAGASFAVLPFLDVENSGSSALLECMAMGKAVVATKACAAPDYIEEGETGLLVEPANPAALRSAIQSLLDDPGRAHRMGSNAREVVEERFTNTLIAEKWRELYRELATV